MRKKHLFQLLGTGLLAFALVLSPLSGRSAPAPSKSAPFLHFERAGEGTLTDEDAETVRSALGLTTYNGKIWTIWDDSVITPVRAAIPCGKVGETLLKTLARKFYETGKVPSGQTFYLITPYFMERSGNRLTLTTDAFETDFETYAGLNDTSFLKGLRDGALSAGDLRKAAESASAFRRSLGRGRVDDPVLLELSKCTLTGYQCWDEDTASYRPGRKGDPYVDLVPDYTKESVVLSGDPGGETLSFVSGPSLPEPGEALIDAYSAGTGAIDGDASHFTDIKESAFYKEPVGWAVSHGITAGVSDTAFAPDREVTRAQFVTFLYRLAGEPAIGEEEVRAGAFADVGTTAFYREAVAWAASHGITAGTGKAGDGRPLFSPDAPCTRLSVVTMLYHAAGGPKEGEEGSAFSDCRFTYGRNAAAWAVEKGITQGTGEAGDGRPLFSPDDPCSRGQAVTFLYRMTGN